MNLEEFIRQNKGRFDEDFSDENSWKKIEKSLYPRSNVKGLGWWMCSAAASIILIVGAMFWVYEKGHQKGQDYAREIMEIEAYYEDKLNQKMVRLADMPVSKEVMHDLGNLDSNLTAKVPKNEIEKEAQLKAIIQSFETRIGILEKIIQRSPSNKNEKNGSHEQSI